MTDKILTVIIPAYNMEAYLPKCLTSIVVEDKGLLGRLEVIVVNDGSKDRTSEVAHEFEQKYSGIFKVIDKSNGNYGSCINAALPVANGAYIKVLDADDTCDPAMFQEYLLRLANSVDSGEVLDMFLSPFVLVNEDGDILERWGYPFEDGAIYTLSEIIKIANRVAMHAIAYRTENLRTIKYRQEEGISYTDTQWCFLPMLTVKRFRYLAVPVYRYLIGREGQTVSKDSIMKNFWMKQRLLRIQCVDYDNEIYESSEQREYLEARLVWFARQMYAYILNILPARNAYESYVEMSKSLEKVPNVAALHAKNSFGRFLGRKPCRVLSRRGFRKVLTLVSMLYILAARFYISIMRRVKR